MHTDDGFVHASLNALQNRVILMERDAQTNKNQFEREQLSTNNRLERLEKKIDDLHSQQLVMLGSALLSVVLLAINLVLVFITR